MLRLRFTDGPRKGEIAEISPEAGWAMLKDGRATDPRFEVPTPAPVAEVEATPAVVSAASVTRRSRQGGRA